VSLNGLGGTVSGSGFGASVCCWIGIGLKDAGAWIVMEEL